MVGDRILKMTEAFIILERMILMGRLMFIQFAVVGVEFDLTFLVLILTQILVLSCKIEF